MQKVTPFLWFDNQVMDAAKFYVSVFKNSKILNDSHYGDEGQEITGKPKGEVMVVQFELDGQKFSALNGGPHFKFTEAISFLIDCKDQEEVDYYWNKLSEGGQESQCGWLKDKFGLSWQVVPEALSELMSDPDEAKSDRVMAAMLKMTKLDAATLKKAYEGK